MKKKAKKKLNPNIADLRSCISANTKQMNAMLEALIDIKKFNQAIGMVDVYKQYICKLLKEKDTLQNIVAEHESILRAIRIKNVG